MTWVLFVGFGILAYIGISLMGQLASGEAPDVWQAMVNIFRPYTLAVMLLANALWAGALYYGLKETKLAVPALIAMGVITSFIYSTIFLGAKFTLLKIIGLLLILAGIFLLA